MTHLTDTSISLASRVTARLFAARFDHQLAACAAPEAGSPAAAHAARLASRPERDRLADWLRTLLTAVRTAPRPALIRVPPNYGPVIDAQAAIDHIIDLLTDTRPVDIGGMARLRILLADGAGPVYLGGWGNLQEELNAVIVAL